MPFFRLGCVAGGVIGGGTLEGHGHRRQFIAVFVAETSLGMVKRHSQ